MATCKDCVHYEVCKRIDYELEYHNKSIKEAEELPIKCRFFKNKSDYISQKAYEQVKWERDTAIEQLKSYGVGFCEEKDVVPVVRCKNCKHWWEENELCLHPKCCHGKVAVVFANSTHFCSYGERKTNNE